MSARRVQLGLTLIELMVVVVVIAVIIGLTAPSFRRTIEMQRLRGVNDQLVTDLQFARAEAARLGIPVHVQVMGQSLGNPACYILFTDTVRTGSFSTTCNCRLPLGSRCSAATTREVKTVQLDIQHRIRFATGATNRIGFDSVTGGMLIDLGDNPGEAPPRFEVDTFMDTPRKLRTIVEYSGRPSNCLPSGSTIPSAGLVPCP